MALENTYLKISNEVRTLDGTYHGEASEKFKAQFDALYKNLQQNETVMSNVIANLKQALTIYTDVIGQVRARRTRWTSAPRIRAICKHGDAGRGPSPDPSPQGKGGGI